MEMIGRWEAAALGLPRFYTGKRCRKGHNSERYVLNGVCCECAVERVTNERKKIREQKAKA